MWYASMPRPAPARCMQASLDCSEAMSHTSHRVWAGRQMMETPLIRAAHNGHFNMVKFLTEHRADVNAIDLVLAPPCSCISLGTPVQQPWKYDSVV